MVLTAYFGRHQEIFEEKKWFNFDHFTWMWAPLSNLQDKRKQLPGREQWVCSERRSHTARCAGMGRPGEEGEGGGGGGDGGRPLLR